MTAPFTFIAQTHNLWGDHHAAEREDAMRALYERRAPDLLATQETRGWSRDLLDAAMPGHRRVQDDFPGWERQSNLWWDGALFSEVEHGAEDVGIHDADARLFWVRLRVTGEDRTILWTTAHLSYSGNAVEVETGVNQRTPQARRVVEELARLAHPDEPVFFASDTNAIATAIWVIGTAGYLDSFSALNRQAPPTHPVVPNPFRDVVGTPKSPIASPHKTIDYIFFRGPVRPRSAEVVEFFDRGISPSDHHPVASTFTLPG
ncbi:endonuclease/exonuclease/phosphatase family metal-dependent hydrolase [Microbacterium sp. W4I4]|uniref:endonuclease/exonuclease/phosphatase family protein n=1 Tax=Microbacterium sp. W4I4 TaxID=3042295 RepID=UPI00278559AB|nr:endonuclease/exonuclease/phosphatase family protein [Microbacterium sp. W4I4]MDQ0614434.1 endonuclease/exonuclease/phosphatase family metal-dependent hydrolase [Microbacterium sp. W4I4]